MVRVPGNKKLWSMSMKELVALHKALRQDPESRNPNRKSIYIYTKKAIAKMNRVSWAITTLLRKNRE